MIAYADATAMEKPRELRDTSVCTWMGMRIAAVTMATITPLWYKSSTWKTARYCATHCSWGQSNTANSTAQRDTCNTRRKGALTTPPARTRLRTIQTNQMVRNTRAKTSKDRKTP